MYTKYTHVEYTVLLVIAFMVMCVMALNDMQLPSLPSMAIAFKSSTNTMQLSVGMAFAGQALSMLFSGALSDAFGRKPVIIIGLGFACCITYCITLIESDTTFIILRFIQGIGSGVGIGIGRVIVIEYFKEKNLKKASAIFSMSVLLSALITPTIGGYIQQQFNWQTNFYMMCILLLISIIIFYYMCPETNPSTLRINLSTATASYKKILTNKQFILWTTINGIFVASYFSYMTVSPFLLQGEYGLTPLQFGLICSFTSIANYIGKSILIFAPHKINDHKMILTALVSILAVGIIIFSLNILHVHILALLLTLIFIFMVTIAIASPLTSIESLKPFENQRGSAGALFSFITLTLTALSCNIVGLLPDYKSLLLGIIFTLVSSIGIASYRFVIHTTK